MAANGCNVDDIELRIGRLGGLEALLKLMQQHKQNLDVQAGAATALFNLSFAGTRVTSTPQCCCEFEES